MHGGPTLSAQPEPLRVEEKADTNWIFVTAASRVNPAAKISWFEHMLETVIFPDAEHDDRRVSYTSDARF
ncbi:hypothetical protein PHSY_001677 [Pseudozyma hubeiensis SY62]|uniref:Uncharacterized protein n=1 Tax=Pseudozyma hubeiensis (strain SY62) TaxID=1305764 RepID=R9NZ38_PSEHS|nr:hypothetical protein PHSY_001677 [Pseudozyma hubeiensis SY62]GAC94108.1 hypothetical protein PHSY_001677 [Pseudozyma hubeiensis SY62]